MDHDRQPDVHNISPKFNNQEDLDDVRWYETDRNIRRWRHYDARIRHDIGDRVEEQYWEGFRFRNRCYDNGEGFYDNAAYTDEENCYGGYTDNLRPCYKAYRPTAKLYDGYGYEWREPRGSSREFERYSHPQMLKHGHRYGHCDAYNRPYYEQDAYELHRQASQSRYARPGLPDENKEFCRKDFSREHCNYSLCSHPQFWRSNDTAEQYYDVDTESQIVPKRRDGGNESSTYPVEMSRCRGFHGRNMLREGYEDFLCLRHINVGTEWQKTTEWNDADSESGNHEWNGADNEPGNPEGNDANSEPGNHTVEMRRGQVSHNDCNSYEVLRSFGAVRQSTPDQDGNALEPCPVVVPEIILSPTALRLSFRSGGSGMRRAALTPTTFCPSGDSGKDVHGNLLDVPTQKVGRRERSASLGTVGSQKFATMKNARRMAQDLGMMEAEEETEEREAGKVEKEHGGRVSRLQWAKRWISKTKLFPRDSYELEL